MNTNLSGSDARRIRRALGRNIARKGMAIIGQTRLDQPGMQKNGADSETNSQEITQLMRRYQQGDRDAREHLFEAVYKQVRAIAKKALYASSGASFSPTELAHEALIRLLGKDANWQDRHHFYNVVAQATRQILVDAARARLREKRGAGVKAESLTEVWDIGLESDATLIRVNDALDQLHARDERRAQVIELTYFGGFDRDEIARALNISIPTVDRDLRSGRAWLKRALED